MTTIITDVVYIDGKKERFTSKTKPSVVDGVLTNSRFLGISEEEDTIFGVQMSEVRRYSYRTLQ